jgi:isopenicillin-N epimerase
MENSFTPMVRMATNIDVLSYPASDSRHWLLDPKIAFLNHGSFGSCPKAVLDYQNEMRVRLERRPVHFLVRELEALMDQARDALARFVGADTEDLVFVPNSTTGVNAVLRSLTFGSGDELLVTNQEYNACRNAVDFVAERSGAKVVVVNVPFPIRSADEVVSAIVSQVTPRTKLALIDHVVSQTGLVMPMEKIVKALAERGVDALVDGAHAPGMVPLDLKKLGAAYYTGNCHKWLCAPKGAGLLYVRRGKQNLIRPLVISHGANSPRKDRSRFLIEFGWTGTWDPSAQLSVAEALRYVGSLMKGGWSEVMRRNRELALAGRKVLCAALGVAEPCPEEFIGSMAAVPLPDALPGEEPAAPFYEFPLQDRLRNNHNIEVPIMPWPKRTTRLVRISAQVYNSLPQYELLGRALVEELARERQS